MVAEAPRGKGAGSGKTRRPPGQMEKILHGPDAIRTIGAKTVRQELKRLAKMRKGVNALVCSAPWFDANWHHGEPYPPGGDTTLMRPCKCCGRMTPPNCIGSSGACEDCRLGAMSPAQLAAIPGSTSSINLAKVKAAIRRGEQPSGGF